MAVFATIVLTAAVIIGGGLLLAQVFSSNRTKALTSLVSAYRFGSEDERTQAFEAVFNVFGFEDSGNVDQPALHEMLDAAKTFDSRYGRYHWGILAEKLLIEECVRRGLGKPRRD